MLEQAVKGQQKFNPHMLSGFPLDFAFIPAAAVRLRAGPTLGAVERDHEVGSSGHLFGVCQMAGKPRQTGRNSRRPRFTLADERRLLLTIRSKRNRLVN